MSNYKVSKPLIRLHCFGLIFTPSLIPTIAFLLILPILISLGFWQLNRAAQKQQILDLYKQQQSLPPLTVNAIQSQKIKNYTKITLTGYYDNAHTLFIDNRTHNRQAGYYVLTPFVIDKAQHFPLKRETPHQAKQMILVNRGWVPRGRTRQQLPHIKPVVGHWQITGKVQYPPKVYMLAPETTSSDWPLLLQAVNLAKISKMLHKPLFPFILLLSPKATHGFVRTWKPTHANPHKSIGYAIQWFALALTLVIIYFVLNVKKVRRGSNERSRKETG